MYLLFDWYLYEKMNCKSTGRCKSSAGKTGQQGRRLLGNPASRTSSRKQEDREEEGALTFAKENTAKGDHSL